jgi:hypothetical protein
MKLNHLFLVSTLIVGATVVLPILASPLFNTDEQALLEQSLGKLKTESFTVTASRDVTRTIQASKGLSFYGHNLPLTESTLTIKATYNLEAGIDQSTIGYSVIPSNSSDDFPKPTLSIALPHPVLRSVRVRPESLEVRNSKGILNLGPDLQSSLTPLLQDEINSIKKDFCQELLSQALDQAKSLEVQRVTDILASVPDPKSFRVRVADLSLSSECKEDNQ